MTIKDVPERPDVERAIRTGYPKEPHYPHCPVCGRVCDLICRTEEGVIVGCNKCVYDENAWDVDECFEEED